MTRMPRPRPWLLIFLLLAAAAHVTALAQDEEWLKLSARMVKEKAQAGETVNAEIAIDIKKGYHLTKDQTKLSVSTPDGIQAGAIATPEVKRENLAAFGMEVDFYEGKGTFTVPLQVAKDAPAGEKEIKLNLIYQGCSDKACFLPAQKEFALKLTTLQDQAPSTAAPTPTTTAEPAPAKKLGLAERFSKALNEGSYVLAGIFAFLAGILLSLTPCVYPMIPITIGVIGAGAGESRGRGFFLSLVYVLGIATMFSILGVAAALSGTMFGEAAGSPKFIAPLTALFIVLGFGMMGAFELQLPPAIAGKFGGKKGAGIVGIFLMGFLGGVIVSPCGAPVIAALLFHVAQKGDILRGFLMFFIMSWGLGILFIIIGTFSGVMSALPKSGGWMEVVKKAMGIAIIAAALYYGKILIRPEALAPIVVVLMVVSGIYASGLLKHGFKAPKGLLLLGIITIVGGIVVGASIPPPPKADVQTETQKESPINWVYSEMDADSRAILEQKPMLIDFGAEWCTQCKRLDKLTFAHPSVVAESKRFIMVKLDYDSKTPEVERLKKEHGILTLPTILFKTSDGEVVEGEIIREFVTAEQLLKRMKRIK